ncbi:magnesium chelatase [Paenibacillus sp. PK3_47]|uniref:cobaltochelatase subunit CobN n=1 Tax=Paenibacillus sp. PK3_47 TaxID=2072642 RepID=UPI00201DE432|nr:cobaltochelatase subunit CobN [Paenibacillus sp. PK3_47]UQZ37006.1 magnesium chelatase [Paenibacillus sp. PK3_47]
MKLVLFTASQAVVRDLSEVYSELSDQQKQELDLSVFPMEQRVTDHVSMIISKAIQQADFIIHDPHGMSVGAIQQLLAVCSSLQAHQVAVGGNVEQIRSLISLGTLKAADLQRGAMQLTDKKQRDYEALQRIRNYWQGSKKENIRNLLYFVMQEYGDGNNVWPVPAEPALLHGVNLYDVANSKGYDDELAYWKANGGDASKPTIAMLFMESSYPMDTHHIVIDIATRLKQHANVLQIAFSSITGVDVNRLRKLLIHGGASGGKVNLIVNFIPFRLGAGPVGGDSSAVIRLLEELQAPLLHPFFLTRKDRTDWENALEGLSPSEFMVQMMLPELDGSIDMLPIAALGMGGVDDNLGVSWKELQLIEDRAGRLTSRIVRWLTLQTKKTQEKKLAIIGYNYPPGEGNLFGGSFLDTFQSISRILTALKKQGYDVEEMTAEELRDTMLGGGLINSAMWSSDLTSSAMLRFPSQLYHGTVNTERAAKMLKQWGKAPGEIMSWDDDFLIPGFINGNIFIGLQPSRGIHEDQEKSYHDKSLLPPHQYLAFYEYLREQFQADAFLHVGTHGTLEFMEGKEAGMSGDCLPDELIADIPHFYYYYLGNPSEAMIAKRRSHAVLVSYQSPPFVDGELYGEFLRLDELLHSHRQAERLSPNQCPDIAEQIRQCAAELHLDGQDLDRVEGELYRMRRSLIPKGLHVLGEGYSTQGAADHLKFVLRHDRQEARSLAHLAAEGHGWNYDALLKMGRIEKLIQLDTEVAEYIAEFIHSGQIPPPPAGLKCKEDWVHTWEFGRQVYEASLQNFELEQLIRGLDGKYIPVKLAGDVVRHPDILPSGYNLVQFDPRSVPSDTAVRRGADLADNTIDLYYKQYGQYPVTTAVVMWGLETSRTQGETFGQILSYLGIRISGRNRFNQPEYKIIPLHELGRPRLNVVVNICGFFRDMFPNLVETLNYLFSLVAGMDEAEEDNRFKKHTQNLYQHLQEKGFDKEDAWDLACARVFGPPEGEYGTRVNKLIETKSWSEESELGKSFSESLKYVYSGKYRGRNISNLFETNLTAVDIVSQVRSNHEHEVTDLDHYYEYFGGLSKSVELAKGTRPEIFISDTTGEKVMTEEVAKSIQRGLQTRLLNPKWIDGLLEHSYHGTQKIAQRFENMLGLAATTNKVESWMFSSLHETYVADEERSRQLENNNSWSYHHLLETLLECHQRGYWTASEEELEQLQNRFMELEGEMEEID